MANGQSVLTSAVLDTAEVDRLSARLEDRERSRHVAHAAQLRDALALERVFDEAGLGIGAAAQLALLWHCSEERAASVLHDGRVLRRLGGLVVMEAGRLTVEQARVVVDVLGPVDDQAMAAALCSRLADLLAEDATVGTVRPPARLRELLTRWLIAEDPEAAAARRRAAEEAGAGVEVWRRDDGLMDLAARALTGPNAQACMAAIRRQAEPTCVDDTRPFGVRLRDAVVDLLTGRVALPLHEDAADSRCRGTGCGCGIGAAVPCGAQVYVHVPLATALGMAEDPAELDRHGPIDPDLLAQLLLAAPVLHRVWVDDDGTPVAVDDRTWQPGRHDPPGLRAALLDLAGGPPPDPDQRHPVHPDDHDPPATSPLRAPRVLRRPHLAGPGPYRPGRRLRRLLLARAPRCEWPGCGRRAVPAAGVGCDVDHDLAWPYGPTCACNTGPLCRRHHRVKQAGWIKRRLPGGAVRWTGPAGRTWTSPGQHQAPPRVVRPLPPLLPPDPFAELDPCAYYDARFASDPSDPWLDGAISDGDLTMPADADEDRGQRWLLDEPWYLRVHDDSAWTEAPPPAEPQADG
jgi:hypothetical protein